MLPWGRLCYTVFMTTKRLVRISYFTMLTIIGGLISIEVPFAPTVKITLQTLFVAASGLVLGGKDGAFAQIAYVVMGLVGIPIFSRGGGPMYVLQPSFGYILSFPLQAFLTGYLVKKQKTLRSFKLFLCASAGVLVSYAVGITYQVLILILYTHSTVAAAFATVPSVLLMLVKDIVLVYLLCLLYPRIMSLIGKANETAKKITAEETPGVPPSQPKEGEEDPEADPKEPQNPVPAPPKNPIPEPAGMQK